MCLEAVLKEKKENWTKYKARTRFFAVTSDPWRIYASPACKGLNNYCSNAYKYIVYTYREGDVSISDCPAYLYSVKPIDEEIPQTIVGRQPTPGIYDSIDGLNATVHGQIQVPNPLTAITNDDIDDYTGSNSVDMS